MKSQAVDRASANKVVLFPFGACLLLSCLLSFHTLPAQTEAVISNVRFSQRLDSSCKVDIFYDLTVQGGDAVPVSMEVSDDHGVSWNYAFDYNHLTGDICAPQAAGFDKHIVWDYKADHPFDFKPAVVIRLKPGGCGCRGVTQFTHGGQVYNTVEIGTQCWMRENLNIGTMVMSTDSGVSHSDCSDNGMIEKYCFENVPANCDIFGGLYDWSEMMGYTSSPGCQGICPSGWHIPTDADWCTLATCLDSTVNCAYYDYSGTNAGGKLKENGYAHWNPPNTGATNESGFTAFGAGQRSFFGVFGDYCYNTYFWSSSGYNESYSIFWRLTGVYATVYRNYYNATHGFSVRCVRNDG